MYEYSRSPILRSSAPNVIFCPPGLKARSALLRMFSNCKRIPCTSSSHGHRSCRERFICFSSVESVLDSYLSQKFLLTIICVLNKNFEMREAHHRTQTFFVIGQLIEASA